MSNKINAQEFLGRLKEGLKEELLRIQDKCLELRKAEQEALAKAEKPKKDAEKNDMSPVGAVGGMNPGGFALSEDDMGLCKGCHKLKKACICEDDDKVEKTNDYIDLRHENDEEKRLKEFPSGKPVVMPGDKLPKNDGADEGSGSEPRKLKKEELGKAGPTFKPGAPPVPAMGSAPMAMPPKPKAKIPVLGKAAGIPAAPKAPKSPGMSNPGGTPAGATKNVNPMAKEEKPVKKDLTWSPHSKPEKMDSPWSKPPPVPKGVISSAPPPKPMKKDEEIYKSAPPGWSEKTMHRLKDKYGEESAFKIAWAAHNKHGGSAEKAELEFSKEKEIKKAVKLPGQKADLPNLSGFQSLVSKKPVAAPDLGGVNRELGGFKSIAKTPGKK